MPVMVHMNSPTADSTCKNTRPKARNGWRSRRRSTDRVLAGAGMDWVKNRSRTGAGPPVQFVKYSGHFIGTLDLLEHNSLEHYA